MAKKTLIEKYEDQTGESARNIRSDGKAREHNSQYVHWLEKKVERANKRK